MRLHLLWFLLPLAVACPPPPPVATRPPGAVELRVDSVPAGASVAVDGLSRGATPLTVGVSAGRHRVHLARSGYFDLDTEVDVPAEGTAFNATLVASH